MNEYASLNKQLDWKKAKAIVAGVDVGAVSSKAMILVDGQPYAVSQVTTRTPGEAASKAINAALRTAAATGKAHKLSDGNALVLEVRPTGAGWWRLRYWLASKEGMLSLGTYPGVSLGDGVTLTDASTAAPALIGE